MSVQFGIFALLGVSICVVYIVSTRTAYILESRHLIASATAYTQTPPDPVGHILIIGDSTAVGVGAAAEETIAGRLGRDFKAYAIKHRAAVGARVVDAYKQLSEAERDTYALILIQVGANDIIQFGRPRRIADDISQLLDAAVAKSERVVFLTAGNIGGAKIFFPPVSTYYRMASRAVRDDVSRRAQEKGVSYVDLFIEPERDPFVLDPQQYLAADGLHPSAAGYAHWYEAIRPHIVLP